MLAELPAYQEYKPTGSKWLGEIPKHWGLHSLRTLTQARSERNQPELNLLSVERERGVIIRDREKTTNHNFIPDDLSNYKVARQGDLVINKMKAWQGSMGIAPCDGIVSPAYYVFRFKFSDRAFAHRLLRSKPYVAHFAAASDGVRIGQWDLSIAGLRKIPIVVPPPDEQELIVRFLDWASVRLGKAIAAKRKVIGLLEEQKQAIIHRAVTRGLDDTVPLKHSGLAWLGDVPEHWDIRRSKYVYREVDDRSKHGNEVHLSMSQRHGLIPSSQVEERRLISDSYAGGKLCRVNDLVLNRLKAHLGVFAIATMEGVISPDYTVLRAVRSQCNKYFELLYKSPGCRRELFVRAKGIVQGFWRLYTDDFYDIKFPVPPCVEQHQIVDSIEFNTAGVNTCISRTNSEICLLHEYRTRLIADVVTGKLDVRDFARTLPADIAEEAAELASSELGDDEFSDSDDELVDELTGEPA